MAGRKRIDVNGEIRSEKITLNLTPTDYKTLKILAHMNQLSISEYLYRFVLQDKEKNAEKIRAFEALQQS